MKAILSKGLAALFTLMITTQVEAVNIDSYVKFLIKKEAQRQGADWTFPAAVAHIESRKGQNEFRIGLIGRKYYGPFGIHKDFLKKWPVDKLEENIRVGISALRGGYKSLRRYNTNYNGAYANAIRQAQRKYRREQSQLSLLQPVGR